MSKLANKQYTIYKSTDKLDLARMRRGLLANFIHSFDSLILWQITRYKYNDQSQFKELARNIFYTVHDSFYITPHYKNTFVRLYMQHLHDIKNYGPIAKISVEDRRKILPLSESNIIEYWNRNYVDIVSLNDRYKSLGNRKFTNDPIVPKTSVYLKFWDLRSYYRKITRDDWLVLPGWCNIDWFFNTLKTSEWANTTTYDLVKVSDPVLHIESIKLSDQLLEPSDVTLLRKELSEQIMLEPLVISDQPEAVVSSVVKDVLVEPKYVVDRDIKKLVSSVKETIYSNLPVKAENAKLRDAEATKSLQEFLNIENKREQALESAIVNNLKKLYIAKEDVVGFDDIVKKANEDVTRVISEKYDVVLGSIDTKINILAGEVSNEEIEVSSAQYVSEPINYEELEDNKNEERLVHMQNVVYYLNSVHDHKFTKIQLDKLIEGTIDYDFLSKLGISVKDFKSLLQSISMENSNYTNFITYSANLLNKLIQHCSAKDLITSSYDHSGITKISLDVFKQILKAYLLHVKLKFDTEKMR